MERAEIQVWYEVCVSGLITSPLRSAQGIHELLKAREYFKVSTEARLEIPQATL